MKYKKFETKLDGKEISFEFGKYAGLADVAVMVKYGDTFVLTTVTRDKEVKEGMNFFPLSVEYEEKIYAMGKIPGGFKKREGRPSDSAILVSRAIDRPMRPLFPSDLRNSVLINNLVIASDRDNSSEFAAMLGSNLAVHVSSIPFNGPISTVMIGYIDGKYILNPNREQRKESVLSLTLAGSKDKIVMIEAGGAEIPNDIMLGAIEFGHKYIKELCEFFDKIRLEIGKEKFEYEITKVDDQEKEFVENILNGRMNDITKNTDKTTLEDNVLLLKQEVISKIEEEIIEASEERKEFLESVLNNLDQIIYVIEKYAIRENMFSGYRVDGRKLDEVRPLNAEVALFKRVHGSGMFTRGETQVMSIATLAKLTDSQRLEGLEDTETKRYMHQYNFPSYSVGEARPPRSPGRREIGHGALAEKALYYVLPSEEEFPYAIRVVSEVLSSNGSTSLASVCGSTLSLMDAGVPIKEPVAGISCGLFTREDGSYLMPVDIQGVEDFFGDMDFKVAGTKNGITAIQVDIKIDGLTIEQIKEAFDKTEKTRIKILNEIILPVIDKPRKKVSEFAPKIARIQIEPEKIGKLIGPSGKNINMIIEKTEVEIDIDDSGLVLIYGMNEEKIKQAVNLVELSTIEYKKGDIVTGKVSGIQKFGAFIMLPNGEEGLLHISRISNKRLEKVEDELSLDDEITVMVVDVDDSGKISLDRKGLFEGA